MSGLESSSLIVGVACISSIYVCNCTLTYLPVRHELDDVSTLETVILSLQMQLRDINFFRKPNVKRRSQFLGDGSTDFVNLDDRFGKADSRTSFSVL